MDHVREWADVVQQTGAAAGVIVSPKGFTSGAIDLAKNPARRVSLWIARPLTDDDFAPDEKSPAGYIKSVALTMHIRVPHPLTETFRLDVEPASGKREGREIQIVFGAKTRDLYYLRDEQDNVTGNLWDDYLISAEALHESGVALVLPGAPRFLVVEGRRMRFNSLSMGIGIENVEMPIEIDATHGAYGYENAITGQIKLVPLNLV